MNITPYVNKIDTDAVLIEQSIEASRGVSQTGIDASSELVSALSAVLGDRIYNLRMPQDVTYPCAVFALDGSEPVLVDGYHTMQIETFVISILLHETSSSTMDSVVDGVRDALDSSSWSFAVMDLGTSYDDETLTYATTIEVEMSIPVLPTQDLPAVLVYPLDVSAGESVYTNLTRQRLSQSIGITIITDSSVSITDARNDLFSALLGYQVTADYSPVEYRGGAAVEGGGTLTVWREVFADAYYIQET